MKNIIAIPARLNSTRLPGKVLLDLNGISMLQRVFNQCLKSTKVNQIFIVTDSIEVFDHASTFCSNVIMTRDDINSGTERVAIALENINYDNVINVQGDEPFIHPELIDDIFTSLETHFIVSSMNRIDNLTDLNDSNVVKVVVDNHSNAIYFSRSPIPYSRKYDQDIIEHISFYQHVGIYGFNKTMIEKYYLNLSSESTLEGIEKLEQLKIIERNEDTINMVYSHHKAFGIDTNDDLEKARKILS
jgi:3-deoxy-manno-octulosonate cytidylyltransferase (CMP-KDO synthetase)